MKVHHISQKNSVLNQFLIEIRDANIQQDRLRFRHNLERIGEILAYEMSKSLDFESQTASTPLGRHQKPLIKNELVICSILRAGLPMHNGVSRLFDHVDNAFISAFRTRNFDGDFEIHLEYCATPDLTSKDLILVDPMLATGHSIVEVYKSLTEKFNISSINILSAIAAQPGIDFLQTQLNQNSQLWVADIDETLNDKGYIVPGLGDAGDLAFGSKL
ncbi:uracil phosphoribosyltransferase [Flavobacteriaceae bacterium 14752]|uniref:uracil phosphoribosyltransferase n=1 Tax=Mesohalobacter salilacus TaxID=2491711 RepID=UPI000F64215B|nr:uracil phosphoribosyltransferase [Flavobacteriaceae bacterium 14752]